jgi:serine/threonine protein kinase/Tfp pilus assembly protein PilF
MKTKFPGSARASRAGDGAAAIASAGIAPVCAQCGSRLGTTDGADEICITCLLQSVLNENDVDPGETPGHSDQSIRSDHGAPIKFGDYELLEEIGRGGQGVVYRARQKILNRIVALKVIGLGPWATEAHLKRFRREAEAAASLDHPSIVPIYDVGERDGSCYFSMKFVTGGQLDEVVRRTPMSVRQAAELIAKLARTVQYAHGHGILHRDIKPGNILVGANGEPHLTDFGLARLVETESTITRTREVMGTPSYMAPEQAVGNKAATTKTTDVYALGAVLYQLLTGHPPFAGETTHQTIQLLLNTEPRNPRALNCKLDHDLSTICLKCLEKDPKRRYSSALALAEDLEHWLKHEPIQARRTGIFARGKRWLRRNPTTAIAAVSVIGLIAALSVIISKSDWLQPAPGTGIAVLPFENLSDNKADAYFAEAIQDEILTRLSKISDLKVIARTSTEHYESKPEDLPTIGRQLGVAYILEGSVEKSADAVRVNVQLIKAANSSHVWADTFDRKLTDVFSVQSDVARAIADQLGPKLTSREEQAIAAAPTNNAKAYDAYLRGLSYSLRTQRTPANSLEVQKYLREAVQLDPKFALAWALLAYTDGVGYHTLNLQPTRALREETRQAAETALALQPALGEAVLAKGYYHYACLQDYDTAVRYLEQAHSLLPNNSRIVQSLADVERTRGQWDRSDAYFNEAERLDPRNVNLLTQHALSLIVVRRFSDAVGKLDQVLDLTPDDVDTSVIKASIAQAEGDLPRAAALLAPLHPNAHDFGAWEIKTYQAILERQPAPIIAPLKEVLANPDPAFGFYNGELRFWLGWAQQVAGDHAAAQQSWQQTRSELEPLLQEQPQNWELVCVLALANMGLGDKTAALALAEKAIAGNSPDTDVVNGPFSLEVFARVAAQTGETDRAIAALHKLLSIPYFGAFTNAPLTPALLRLDPMFDPLRGAPRFQKLCEEKQDLTTNGH